MTDQPTTPTSADDAKPISGSSLLRKAIYVVGGIAVVIGLVIVVGFLLPSKFKVKESIEIEAPIDIVYAHVATPKDWPTWTAWNTENYPSIEYSFSGPESGVDATLSWTDPNAGAGSLVFTAAEANERLDYEMHSEVFAQPMAGDFTFEQSGQNVTVVWTASGDVSSNILFRYMGLIFPGEIGREFREGLDGLKALSETLPEATPAS